MLIPTTAMGAATFLRETFEETVFENGAPPGWTKSFQSGSVDWQVFIGDRRTSTKAHGGSYNAIIWDGDSNDNETYLITPVINIPAGTTNTRVEFWHMQAEWDGDQDTLQVYYKTSEGGAWTLLAGWTTNVASWTKREITLPNPCSTYYIGFLGNAKWGCGVCIDDVKVTGERAGDGVTNYYAVVCGVADYEVDDFDLNYCDDDARDVCDALLTSENWVSDNIVVLTDSAASKEAIRTAIENMANTADDDDVCLFFFSGHGTSATDVAPLDESDGVDEYIVPYDSLEDSYDNDIRDDEFGDWIGRLATDKYVILLDTCYSGGMTKGLGAAGSRGKGIVKETGIVPQKGDGFAADIAAAGAGVKLATASDMQAKDLRDNGRGVVIAACADDEMADESDELQNGVFTYYLVEGMAGAADDDGDGRISAEECFDYIKPRAKAVNPVQNAQIYDAVSGELDFIISHAVVTKCAVKAGSSRNGITDSITIQGQTTFGASDFAGATSVAITISSQYMDPCVLTFPVDDDTFKNGKFSSSGTDVNGVKKSFKCDTNTHKFTFSAKKINLTGLGCPLTVDINVGDSNETIEVDEAIVNGKKPIPINLMMGVTNSLRVDKITVKQGTKPSSDQLTVKGGFAAEDADVDMVNEDFYVTLDLQAWTIPLGSFKAGKGKFSCSKIGASPGGIATASFDFNKGTFTLTIKNADIDDVHGTVGFGVAFDSFDESVNVVLP